MSRRYSDVLKAWAAAVMMLLGPSAASGADYWWVGADYGTDMSYYLDGGLLTNNGSAIGGLLKRVLESARRAGKPFAYNRDQVRFGCVGHTITVLNQVGYREDGQINRSDTIGDTLVELDGTPGGKLWTLACDLVSDAEKRTFVHVGSAKPDTVDGFIEREH